MARFAAAARPIDGEWITRRALEAAVLLAHVGEGVVQRPVELLIERRGEDPDAELLRLAAQIAPQLAHAIELLADPRIARRDGARRRHDARWLRVHGAAVLLGEREPFGRPEVEVERAGLIQIARVGNVDARVQAIAEDRSVPVEIRPYASRRGE